MRLTGGALCTALLESLGEGRNVCAATLNLGWLLLAGDVVGTTATRCRMSEYHAARHSSREPIPVAATNPHARSQQARQACWSQPSPRSTSPTPPLPPPPTRPQTRRQHQQQRPPCCSCCPRRPLLLLLPPRPPRGDHQTQKCLPSPRALSGRTRSASLPPHPPAPRLCPFPCPSCSIPGPWRPAPERMSSTHPWA